MYTVTVPPVNEPISLAAAKRFLRVDWNDDDDLIADLISAAREAFEKRLGRSLGTQTIQAVSYLPDLVMAPLSGVIGETYSYAIELPQPPLQSVSLVEIEKQISQWTALVVTDDYLVDADSSNTPRVFLAASALANWAVSLTYPGQKPRVRVTYTAGYGAEADSVPHHMRATLRRLVAYAYEHRDDMAFAFPDEMFGDTDRVLRL